MRLIINIGFSKKYTRFPVFLLLVFTCALSNSVAAELVIDEQQALFDMTTIDWSYVVTENEENARYQDIIQRSTWGKTRVGKRWDLLGHDEMIKKTVWIKTQFNVSKAVEGNKIGFFCTAIDDDAVFYLNGTKLDSVSYHWGAIVKDPTQIDLTPAVQFGRENTLVIQVIDRKHWLRVGGLLGHVKLYRTVPFTRTQSGGIHLTAAKSGNHSVVLHVGDAVLSQGNKTAFSKNELTSMHIPPSILREDELILVIPSEQVKADGKYKVDLDKVNPTTMQAALSVQCDPLPQQVKQYELMDIPLRVSATYTNPFDPEQINVQAVIQTPSGEIEKVPAFFTQDFKVIQVTEEQEILLPVASNPWKLYYRPRQVGQYTMELFAQDRSGIKKHDAGSFQVTHSEHKGYLRISQTDPRFFEFENGESFYGTGPSGWYRGSHFIFGGNPRWVPVKMMDEYYERKAQSGSTYEYLATFHYGLLFIKGGFMDLHTTWKLEHSLRTMERLGIYWDVFHDDILRQSRYGFEHMPYSVDQGGPCEDLYEVYYNEEALRMQKNQLRYLVSRMSDSPAIWVWNCGDERGGRPGRRDFSEPLIFSWLKELHGYIRQIDIYDHPNAIGESSSILNGGDVLHIESWYYRGRGDEDQVQKNIDFYNQYLDAVYPVINVEGGLFSWNQTVYPSGKPYNYPEPLSFHNHLWLSLFMKSAAGGTEWLNIVLDYDNEMYHAGIVNKFLQNESLTDQVWECKYPELFHNGLRGFVLQSKEKSMVWVHNKQSIWYTRVQGESPNPAENAVIRIPVSGNGKYRVEFWNTYTGEIFRTETKRAMSKRISLTLPKIENDIALKVILVD